MKRNKIIRLGAGGAVTGAVNGLLGGGGGMLAVPVLQRWARLPVREAHATASAVILPASLLSGCVYLSGAHAPFGVLIPAALGVALGGFFGAKLLARAAPGKITAVFALLMLAAGLRMFFS